MQVQSLGWEDTLERQVATHCSVLAWEILWTEEPLGLQSMGLQRVEHDRALTQERNIAGCLLCFMCVWALVSVISPYR